ncbi:MAG: acyl-CoA synthetase FdrA [Nitrospiraceae bacterium]
MSGVIVNRVRKGFYLDSVALMRLSKAVSILDGVEDAALMIGTPSNKQFLAEAGLLADDGEEATVSDLIIGIRAKDHKAAKAALAHTDALLKGSARRPGGQKWRPKTLRAAMQVAPDANLAIISVPGTFAAAEARKALRLGLHVMVFSDNVPLEDEISLKREAQERGQLVMGPDCGTAIINGIPLVFANRVPKGSIGIIAASGTGFQEVASLIARAGQGISQGIGTGGRDLADEVGGITTLMAIDALDADPETEKIILLSKPPGPRVATAIVDRVALSPKAFTLCFLELEQIDLPNNATLTPTLKAAAEHALGNITFGESFLIEDIVDTLTTRGRWVRGLYTGGTLCAEAQMILIKGGLGVASNAPVPGATEAAADSHLMHVMLDLGADEYTAGRPHPMIDPEVRSEHLHNALNNEEVAVLLLDVVIGFGAHRDPAGWVAAVLDGVRHQRPTIIASVCGTEGDPQIRSTQVRKLEHAGVIVAPSNAQAAELALRIVQRWEK